MTYEVIALNELNNRAPNAYQAGDLSFFGPDTPDTFFSVQYWYQDRQCWWNGYETTDQAKAEAELARYEKMRGPDAGQRIVIVARPAPEPPAPQTETSEQQAESAIEEVSSRQGAEIEVVSVFYRNQRDVDADQTMTETVRALPSGTLFTAEELARAVHSVHPHDEECGDMRFLEESARRLLRATLSNRMSPVSLFLCDEQGDHYIRQ